MAFIKRKITEEDKIWLDTFKIPNPFLSRFKVAYGMWITEDKEQDAALLCLGGQGYMKENGYYLSDIPIIFILVWKNHLIYIHAWHYCNYIGELEVEVTYSIDEIYGSPEIRGQKEIIKKMVEDGIVRYGIHESHKRRYKVHASISKIVDPRF